MLVRAICLKCTEKNKKITWVNSEVNSDLIAISECNKGHKQVTRINQHVHEVLFCSGLESFSQKFYSESIMSLSVSWERLRWHFSKIYLRSIGYEFYDIEELRKKSLKLSERQLGAFTIAWKTMTGENWILDQKMTKFRNEIIHNGKISSRDEGLKYGEYVTRNISKVCTLIKSKYSSIDQEILEFETNKRIMSDSYQEQAENSSLMSTFIDYWMQLEMWKFDKKFITLITSLESKFYKDFQNSRFS